MKLRQILFQLLFPEESKNLAVLTDENADLWRMMDEIRDADIANHQEVLQEMIVEKILDAERIAHIKPAEA